MNRHTRLRSVTPLKRSPLRRVGKKARAKQRARAKCIESVRERSGGRCEVRGCTHAGSECHEKLPRSAGGSITDPSNCLWVCSHCHKQIHARPLLSRQLGLLLSRYEGQEVGHV